ncbi:MAG: CoA transferase, partial [Gammaproteobacteria bacterium]
MFQSPLRGVRIVEQGTFITGPCAAMMLADLGAD